MNFPIELAPSFQWANDLILTWLVAIIRKDLWTTSPFSSLLDPFRVSEPYFAHSISLLRNKCLALDKRPPLRYQKKISARALDRIITVINILKLYQFGNRLLFSAMSWFKMWQERKKSVRALWRCMISSNQDVGLLSGINDMIQDICPRLWSELYNHSLQLYILDFYFFLAQIWVPKRTLLKKKKKKKHSNIQKW